MAGPAVGGDVAAVLADDPVGDAEPEPGARRALGGDEGVEDLRQDLGGDPGAGVLERDSDAVRAKGPGDDHQAALPFGHLGHCLLGVRHEVDEDLLELVAVRPHRRKAWLHVPVDLHALDPEVGRGERQDLLDEIVQHHVAPLERHLPAERQQAPHDVARGVRRLADHLRVFLEPVGRLLLEDVARADQHRQRIVELVGDAGDELAERRQLRGLDHLLLRKREAELLILDDFLQPMRGLLRLLEEARVVDGVRRVGGERVEELQIGLAEHAGRAGRDFLLGEIHHADDPLGDAQRHADERSAAVARVARLTEAGILLDVLDHDRLAHLDDLARDALADLHLDGAAASLLEPAPDRDTQGPAVAVEEHDRSDARADGAHRALEDVGEQVLDARDAGGHLDHVVEGAELEHEVLETLGRRAQLDEHAPEGLRDLADLVDLTEARDGRRRRALGRGRGGRALPLAGGGHRLSERASEVGNTLREPAEEDVAEEGDREGAEDTDLGFGRFEELEPPHEVHEDQERQDGGQREDGAGGFAELH